MRPALLLACLTLACGSVTLAPNDLGSTPIDATAPDVGTAMADRRPVEDSLPDFVRGNDAGQPETQPPFDGGAALPVCPDEILHYDCPQPKCDCRDR